MIDHQENTPPSSINGEEIVAMDDELFVEDLEEVQELPDDIIMEEEYTEDEDYFDIENKPEDLATVVFDKHKGSVFCGDIHPTGKYAVTGAQDDKAYVWSTENGMSILECTGHNDSVVFVGFSFDGAYLATADMSGFIKVWKCRLDDSQQPWPIAYEYQGDDLTWALWHFGSRVLISGATTGNIFVLKIPSGETKVLQGHNTRSECGKVFHDGVRLASGYKDGSIKIWDLKTSAVLHHIPAGTHRDVITAIDIHPDNSLLASTSLDGKVVMITPSNGRIVNELRADVDLETIAFSPDPQLGYFALGTLLGSLSIWDTNRRMLRHQCARTNDTPGVTKIIWVKDQIVTACMDGTVRVYDAKSGDQKFILTGHLSQVLDICYNAKENILLVPSDGTGARIFKFTEKSDRD